MAANVAAQVSTMRKMMMARRAMRPEDAASRAAETPSTTKVPTKGTTVICNAFNHSLPMGCAMAATRAPVSGTIHARNRPMTAAVAKATSTRVVAEKGNFIMGP